MSYHRAILPENVKVRTVHFRVEHGGSACGRVGPGGNLTDTPDDVTCKQCGSSPLLGAAVRRLGLKSTTAPKKSEYGNPVGGNGGRINSRRFF